MNDTYNETIERKGRIYHYDADTDIYCPRYPAESPVSKYAWIVVTVMLAVVCWCIEALS